MDSGWRGRDDPSRLVDVRRARLIAAYEKWQRLRDRSEHAAKEHSDQLFVKEIRRKLEISGYDLPKRLGVPSRRSIWSEWRKKTDMPLIKLRLDVCYAIHMLTDEDVTENGFLRYLPVNITDMVTLSTINAFVVSSEGRAKNMLEHDIVIDTIIFRKSKSVVVNLAHTKKNRAPHDTQKRIGSARFSLREASITTIGFERIQPILTHLPSGTSSPDGKSTEVELMIDEEDFARWRAQPPVPREALQARIDGLRLCSVTTKPESSLVVVISVDKEEIQPDIKLDRPTDVSDTAFQTTRKKLIEQVLRHRAMDSGSRERYVVSSAGVRRA